MPASTGSHQQIAHNDIAYPEQVWKIINKEIYIFCTRVPVYGSPLPTTGASGVAGMLTIAIEVSFIILSMLHNPAVLFAKL